MWRLIYSIPLWAAFIALRTALIVLGWCLVPAAAAARAYRKDSDGKYHFTWRLLWLWDNYEDGIANDTYVKFDSMFMKIVYWSCIRNPVNNLRIVPILSCKVDPTKIGYVGSFDEVDLELYDTQIPHWFFCWNGLYSCWYWQFVVGDFGPMYRVWCGWKVYPTDVNGVTEYRKLGAGFALQFKRVN